MAERVGDLEIEQDLAHERASWRVKRFGWGLLFLVWLAGLAGLWGSGPLSGSTASGPGLRLDYARFVRSTAPQELRLLLDPGVTARPTVRLWVDRRYLESQQIESIVPEPKSVEAGSERMFFTLSIAEPGSPISVMVRLQTQRPGFLNGSIGTEGGGLLRFHQIVYP